MSEHRLKMEGEEEEGEESEQEDDGGKHIEEDGRLQSLLDTQGLCTKTKQNMTFMMKINEQATFKHAEVTFPL